MSSLIGMIVFLIFAFIWYFPLYKSKPIDRRPEPKLFLKAFFMGLGPAFLVGLILPCILGFTLKALSVSADSFLYKTLISAIGYGIGEELSKFLIAYLILKKIGYRNKTHASLLFGAVGLGFGVLESFLVVTSLASALVRGMFSLHVFFQLFMGLYYGDGYEKKILGEDKASRKSLILAFIVPMLVHMIHDVVGYQGLNLMSDGNDNSIALGLVLFIFAIAIDILFIVFTLRKVKKS